MTTIQNSSRGLLLGLDAGLLQDLPGVGPMHPAAVAPWHQLCEAAKAAGFELRIASGYRNFERQLAIFNAKAEGRRPLLDDSGAPLDVSTLSNREKLNAILRFSALPGTSRHHWGTDFDVVDAAAVSADYCVQLTAAECAPGGVFAGLHQWLDDYLATGNSGFYRPYDCDRGGVAPEPWHLSYAPVADELAAQMQPALLREQLALTAIALKEDILTNIEALFSRFVVRTPAGYPRHD